MQMQGLRGALAILQIVMKMQSGKWKPKLKWYMLKLHKYVALGTESQNQEQN